MKSRLYAWLRRSPPVWLYLGCADLSDADCRRTAALHNITAYVGTTVSAVFALVNLLQRRPGTAAVLLGGAVLMAASVVIRHRTRRMEIPAWMGISAAGASFIYMLARVNPHNPAMVWVTLFPFLALFILGHVRGAVMTGAYVVVVAVVLFVPGAPGVTAVYPIEISVRVMAALAFAGVIAWYNERASHVARARLRAEIEIRRRAEAELVASSEAAARASQAKSDFLAALSHEVRTPLTAIMGLNDMLLATALTPEQRRFVDLTNGAGRGLVSVMDDILDLAKVEAGKLTLRAVPFDLQALTAGVVELQGILAHDRPVQVRLDWHHDTARFVVGDPDRIRQILTNLMSNALKFTAQGSVTLRAEPSPSPTPGAGLRLAVEDTGIGLASEVHAAIFEPFAQAEAGRQHGGTGLGLAISRRLAQAMGGTLEVCSTPGQGATFSLRLSLPVAERPVEAVSQAIGRYHGRVLIVEDNDLNREVLRAMIERTGCVVETATNGAEALSAFVAARYDLVLMDCQMPVLDGFAATQRMRQHEADGSRTPIVAITAYALPEDTERCRAAGMDDHLTKPLTIDKVAAALSRWLVAASATQDSKPPPPAPLAVTARWNDEPSPLPAATSAVLRS